MNLSKDIIKAIEKEYTAFKDEMYAGKTKDERQKMGQFFTPPAISVKMLENFSRLPLLCCP